MLMIKRCRAALWLVATAGSVCGCVGASAAGVLQPSPDVFWPMLLKLVPCPTLRIDPAVAGAAIGVPADRFRHIEPDGRDDPGGDVLGPDQGWPFYLDLPYAESTPARQGARFSFVKEWPVRRTTALPMCIGADRARVDIAATDWTYLGKTTDWTSKPRSTSSPASNGRCQARRNCFWSSTTPVSDANDRYGCLFHLEIDTDLVLKDALR